MAGSHLQGGFQKTRKEVLARKTPLEIRCKESKLSRRRFLRIGAMHTILWHSSTAKARAKCVQHRLFGVGGAHEGAITRHSALAKESHQHRIPATHERHQLAIIGFFEMFFIKARTKLRGQPKQPKRRNRKSRPLYCNQDDANLLFFDCVRLDDSKGFFRPSAPQKIANSNKLKPKTKDYRLQLSHSSRISKIPIDLRRLKKV